MSLPTDDKARKALPIFTYDTEYFPDAHIEEVRVAVAGNLQHNPGQPLHWAREKSKDQMNTAYRHMLDHKAGNVKDTDGCYHLAKAIWRLKAELQLTIENDRAPAKSLRAPGKSLRSSEPADLPAPEVSGSLRGSSPSCPPMSFDGFRWNPKQP